MGLNLISRRLRLGDFLKSLVYGGMDGIITTFAVVCAACGAEFTIQAIITVGLSSLVADAISMGIGDFISDTAEQDLAVKEQRRRREQIRSHPHAAKEELLAFYKRSGVSDVDAEALVKILSRYDALLPDELMIHIDSILPPDHQDLPWQKGLATFFSFLLFGSVPLVIFFVGDSLELLLGYTPLMISSIASALTMFVLGAVSGSFTHQGTLRSGLFMTLHGLLAAYAAYIIGQGMEAASGAQSPPIPVSHTEL